MKNKATPLLISLKPDYADLVFSGLKTAELRRRISEKMQNRDVYIYVSSPIKQLRGGFRVGQVWSGSPTQIWSTVRNLAGVSKRTFDSYYNGQNIAFALEILDVWEYAYPRSLEQLRSQFPGFVAPQSYRYARIEEVRSFRALKRLTISPRQSIAV